MTYFYSNPKTFLGFLYSVLRMLCNEQLQQMLHNYREININFFAMPGIYRITGNFGEH